ncbi:glycosyl transferase family 2 [Christiangramia fulva]|uniref:Glycosyl transferase family 2 n=1 Tax=Christiangramia fulva TaxID=2126553 RepID=A0A2R3Z4U6_9FLAO|nr:glycosyltransferase family 2 protein [Christiangramia fulva]AVR45281.1 glycosyl transferase family 2 [Christiangramia fulva]
MISIIILTLNEEQDLPICLDALGWCDDIHLLDSGSTDNTLAIAESYSLTLHYNAFSSFGQQRNHALDAIATKYDWILFLDADEVVTPAFVTAIKTQTAAADEAVAGFYCCWKMMLNGRWLKHCDNFPKWQFRLLRRGRVRFTDFGHGQKEGEIDGVLEYIKEPYLHFSFSKGWTEWFARHNKYSSQEAKSRLESNAPFKDIFASNTSQRNPALKAWLVKIPGWPFLRFLQAYFLNLGFLEGKHGYTYCVNMAFYEHLIKIKMKEIKYQSITKEKQTLL